MGRCSMELVNVVKKAKKKDDRKQVILRLPPHKHEKLKRIAATRSMMEGKSVTVQKILEGLVDSLVTPAALLPSSEMATAEEA